MNIFKRIHAWLNPGHDPVALDTHRQLKPKVSAQRPHMRDRDMDFADTDIEIRLDYVAQYREELAETELSTKFPGFKIPARGQRARLAQKLEALNLGCARHLAFVRSSLRTTCDVELVHLDYPCWLEDDDDDSDSGEARLTFATEDDLRRFEDYVYSTAHVSHSRPYCPGFRDVRAYLPMDLMRDLCIAFNDIPATTSTRSK